MRILLDECVPGLLARDIVGHDTATVSKMGRAGIRNGNLLNLAQEQFDELLTVDRGIEYQQNFTGRPIALVVLDGPTRLPALRLLVPALLKALESISPGDVLHIPVSREQDMT